MHWTGSLWMEAAGAHHTAIDLGWVLDMALIHHPAPACQTTWKRVPDASFPGPGRHLKSHLSARHGYGCRTELATRMSSLMKR
jgi:hypothetical protein